MELFIKVIFWIEVAAAVTQLCKCGTSESVKTLGISVVCLLTSAGLAVWAGILLWGG
jgi:hypothetical protein